MHLQSHSGAFLFWLVWGGRGVSLYFGVEVFLVGFGWGGRCLFFFNLLDCMATYNLVLKVKGQLTALMKEYVYQHLS